MTHLKDRGLLALQGWLWQTSAALSPLGPVILLLDNSRSTQGQLSGSIWVPVGRTGVSLERQGVLRGASEAGLLFAPWKTLEVVLVNPD